MKSAVAMATVIAATFASCVTVGTRIAAVVLLIFQHIMPVANFTMTIRAGTFGNGWLAHSANI